MPAPELESLEYAWPSTESARPWSQPFALPREAYVSGRTQEDAAWVWMKHVAWWREEGFQLGADGTLETVAD